MSQTPATPDGIIFARPHRIIAERVKSLRKGRGWSAERLAAAMTGVGVAWDRSIVANLESGRRSGVSVEEMLALAYVLSVAPVHLMVPTADRTDDGDHVHFKLTPEGPATVPSWARAWIRGETPLARVDARRYYTEVPDTEWSPPADRWTPEYIERQSRNVA